MYIYTDTRARAIHIYIRICICPYTYIRQCTYIFRAGNTVFLALQSFSSIPLPVRHTRTHESLTSIVTSLIHTRMELIHDY